MTPLPRQGDVLNYVYLCKREADAGCDEGVKAPGTSLAIPTPVAKAMGLDGTGSSLVPGELNAFDWVGHDLRTIGKSASFLFGRCPPGFFAAALDACIQSKSLSRD